MSEDKNDLLIQYHNAVHKLKKKRILKKPNVAEACEQFEQLGISFEREDLPQYTGMCYQTAAKLQNSLGNTLEEGLLLLKASRHFMSGYLENVNEKFVSNKYLLNHSYVSYRDCLQRLNDCEELSKDVKNALMGSIALKMADDLAIEADLPIEGTQEYEKALELFSSTPLEKINCLQKLLSLKIEEGDYRECLKLINDVIEENNKLCDGGYKRNLSRCAEITRIFLLLILRPTHQQMTPAVASVLEKYAWVDTSSSSDVKDLSVTLKNQELAMLGEDLFLKLQSLVMSCQYCDIESLEHIEQDLIMHLDNEQKTLLRTLVKEYTW